MEKKTHLDQFLATCTDEQLMTILAYIKATKEDHLDALLASEQSDEQTQESTGQSFSKNPPEEDAKCSTVKRRRYERIHH